MSRSKPYNSGIPVVTHDAVECRRLLGLQDHAAVELVRLALPAVLSVPYVVDGADVVLTPAPGAVAGFAGTTVAVSVDVDDHRTGAMWRVVVIGQSQGDGDTLRVPIVGPVAFWVCASVSGTGAVTFAADQRKVCPSPR